jgi:DNA-binding cell septation regulator SpoVG
MAVRAGGGVEYTGSYRLLVNTSAINLENAFVAFAARGRYVLLPNPRTQVGGWKDIVHAMAVITDRSSHFASADGARVHA